MATTKAGDRSPTTISEAVTGFNHINPDAIDTGVSTLSADVADNVGDKASATVASAISLAGLDGKTGFRLNEVAHSDDFGKSVSSAGDVNGDGLDDLIVGAPGADSNGHYNAGSSYVVFGKASGFASTLDLATLDGKTGFRLDGVASFDGSGASVSSAGDVNGDGFDDLIVGAYEADPNGNSSAGTSYVVFGKASGFSSTINLSTLNGKTGFRLDGMAAFDESGFSVSSAGDVNGDGLDDLIIGAPTHGGASYVVFGKASGFNSTINLSTLNGKTGFRLDGVGAYDHSGTSVSSAGDVNGDGLDDLIIGAPGHGGTVGASYVVFGKVSGFASSINLSTLNGSTGFRLDGAAAYDHSGFSVSSAGDVNGDGFDDLIVGAYGASSNGQFGAGSSYVVFGKAKGFASTLDLATLDGKTGFRLDGASVGDWSGISVSSAGDVNGDGFDDLIIGAYGADPSGSKSGASYVVFGKASGFASTINLATLDGNTGFRLDGVAAGDYSGASVSAAGDVNGDGFDDLIVGAPYADSNGDYSREGSSYVVFGGSNTGAVTYYLGTNKNDTLNGTSAAERFVGGNGNDSMTGGGGADVFNGGQGNDVVTVSSLKFQLVDGGNGSDTLALSGADMNLKLVKVHGKVENIEAINLTGSGNNSLALTKLEVLNLSDSSNRLTIDGNSGDKVTGLASGWTDAGISGDYHTYTQGQATILVGVHVTTDHP